MPRSVKTNAARSANSKFVVRKHGDHGSSHADVTFECEDAAAAERESRQIVAARRDRLTGARWVSTRGLCALLDSAIVEFEDAVGQKCFPYNYGPHPEWRNEKLSGTEAAARIQRFARLGGWIRAAAQLPGVRKLLSKNLSTNGMNSPYTRITPEAVMAKYPSPGRFERKLWAAKKKAQAVLSAYHGDLQPSWIDVAHAILAEPRPNKAGLIAAAGALGFFGENRRTVYRDAREWLVTHRSAAFSTTVVVRKEHFRRETGVIPYQLRPFAELIWNGIEIYEALGVAKYGQRKLAYAVVCGPHTWVVDAADAVDALRQCRFADDTDHIEARESRVALPFAFQQLLVQTYNKANALLDGWRSRPAITWTHCANVLLRHRVPDEATKRVLLGALGLNADENLEAYSDRSFPIEDTSDGVRTYLAAEPELRRHGISVTRALKISDDGKRSVIRLVRKDGRTYHHSGWGDAQVAMHEAIRAWQRQEELAAEARKRHGTAVAFLEGSELGFCPLISRSDSYAAGNCSAGTEQWVLEHGWRAKQFVPGPALIAYLEDPRVQRVVEAARRRRLNELRAVAA